MCDVCITDICAYFDELVRDYYRDFPPVFDDDEKPREKYMPMDVRNAPESADNHNDFKKMVEASTGIGYQPGEFMNKLAKKCGLKDQVQNWARGKIPNGLARKVILTCAERMIREGGAEPTMSLLQEAA